jgi:hypothetical protein
MNTLADTSTLITWLLTALTVGTAVAALAVVVCALAVVTSRWRSSSATVDATVGGTAMTARVGGKLRSTSQRAAAGDESLPPQLPGGAEAALNAIGELRPDPRNVVVTHRDPTGEVRLYPLSVSDDRHIGFQRTA